jgi:hypothetical protein
MTMPNVDDMARVSRAPCPNIPPIQEAKQRLCRALDDWIARAFDVENLHNAVRVFEEVWCEGGDMPSPARFDWPVIFQIVYAFRDGMERHCYSRRHEYDELLTLAKYIMRLREWAHQLPDKPPIPEEPRVDGRAGTYRERLLEFHRAELAAQERLDEACWGPIVQEAKRAKPPQKTPKKKKKGSKA